MRKYLIHIYSKKYSIQRKLGVFAPHMAAVEIYTIDSQDMAPWMPHEPAQPQFREVARTTGARPESREARSRKPGARARTSVIATLAAGNGRQRRCYRSSVLKVSQDFRLPDWRPALNQRTRWAEVP